MQLVRYHLRNFRRLEDVSITLEADDTIFVGPNNSAKTSATSAFRMFVAQGSGVRIHDFSSSLMSIFDACTISGNDVPEAGFPTMELDLWFEIEPTTEYGRISSILSSVGMLTREVGLRIQLSADDPAAMLTGYRAVYPPSMVDGVLKSDKTLSHFLSEGTHFKRYFSFKYFSLECPITPFSVAAVSATALEKDFGKTALSSLLRVDFVEAHRNIDDIEVSRSNRLSSVFADFYKSNLEQLEFDAAAISVINKSNDQLTANYKVQFKSLFDVIGRLGFPSIHDRSLLLLSSLNPDSALRGNTTLRYEETGSGHQLPESYNGLGFKNMIFMAIQISHFQKRWICTEKNRPLCQVIFIEEPEVHLHAQVQQAFIRQIAEIAKATAAEHKTPTLKPQLIVTTHSSHILDEVDFTKVRYFRRVQSRYTASTDPATPAIKTATQVLSLRDFVPDPPENSDPLSEAELVKIQSEAVDFLKKYLKLTHCDLFFSDAAVLVEGTVERLLLPIFIKNRFEGLKAAYLTVLEVGGAFAHLFIPLVDFIGLPTLIITDLDSVDPATNRETCRADKAGAVTSNKTLSSIYKTARIAELLLIPAADRVKSNAGNPRFIAFQMPVTVNGYAGKTEMIPRTFEESFIYTNLPAVRSNQLKTFTPLPDALDYETDYNIVYEAVKSKGYKKVEFALQQLATNHKWLTPEYICDGLDWLNKVVAPQTLGTLIETPSS